MKRFFSLLCVAGLLVLNVSAQRSRAPAIPQPPMIDPTTGLPIEPQRGPRFELHFKGGTPSELLDKIAGACGVRPNAIIQPNCRDILFPAFDLHEVTAADVFIALNRLSNFSNSTVESGSWEPSSTGQTEIWILTRRNPQPQPGFVPPMAVPLQPKVCRVFNLDRFLDQFTVEDITTAVQGAWELLNPDEKPSIKYHKDTKLLIVVGQENQLLVVTDVLRELATSVDTKPKGDSKKTEPKTDEKPARKL